MERGTITEVQKTEYALERLQVQGLQEDQCTLAGQSDNVSQNGGPSSCNGLAKPEGSTSSEYLCYFVHRFLAFRSAFQCFMCFKLPEINPASAHTCPIYALEVSHHPICDQGRALHSIPPSIRPQIYSSVNSKTHCDRYICLFGPFCPTIDGGLLAEMRKQMPWRQPMAWRTFAGESLQEDASFPRFGMPGCRQTKSQRR